MSEVASIARPSAEGSVVPRPRLVRILEDADLHRLVLVAAPPGSGKTTVLRQWVATLPPDSWAWVSGSELGDDGHAAWATVGEVTARAWPDSRGLPPLRQGALDLDALAAMFPDDDQLEARHRFLIVDDAHAIRDRNVRRALLQVVDHGPKTLHLVLGTRSDPELPLHRMRAQGELLELRDADLRFRRDETATFLDRCGVGFLTPEQVDLLDERTEGWSTGLRLVAISLRRSDDPPAFLETFAGTDRNIADYLIREVLDRQPEQRYWFLLDTAAFDRLTPELCAAVTGRDDALEQLEQLEREHLFVSRVGAGEDVFRYHELFREMLRYVLRSRHRGRELAVLSSAASWHEVHGEYRIAIDEWLSAGATSHALDAMGRYLDPLLDDDVPVRLVDRWTERTQHLALSSDLWSLLGHAARLGWAKHWDDLFDVLERCGDLLGEQADDLDARMVIDVLSGFVALSRGEPLEARRHFAAATVAWTPGGGAPDHAELVEASGTRAHLGLALSELLLGDPVRARATARLATQWSSGRPSAMLFVRALVAFADFAEGRLRSSRHRVDRLSQDIDAFHLEARPQRALGLRSLVSGFLALEATDLDDARDQFDEHLSTTTEPLGTSALLAELGVIEVVHATGVDEDALARLDLVRRQRRDLGDAVTDAWIDATECRILAELGQLDAAEHILDHLPGHPSFGLLRAEVELSACRPDAARATAAGLPDASPRLRLHRALIEARASLGAGDRVSPEALRAIVDLGESEGFVRTVLRNGGAAVVDLMLADPDLSSSDYVQSMRRLIEHSPVVSVGSGALAGLIDPLSEREREVMRYLPTRLSCREIAGELYVSVNTVKTHVQAIYRKLGCNTRQEAVDRARALRMIT
jgi:LuxR family maltose regulon positive regulatory protein